MADLSPETIEAAAEALLHQNAASSEYHGDSWTWREFEHQAKAALEAAAPLIQAAERIRILGTDEDPSGILDQFQVAAVVHEGKPLVHTYCGRCRNVQIIARDFDGDQAGLTLGELAETAMRHEDEEHTDG